MPRGRPKMTRRSFIYDWNALPVVLGVAEVCTVLGVGEATVKRMCADGELPARKIGGMWRIGRTDLMRLVGDAD